MNIKCLISLIYATSVLSSPLASTDSCSMSFLSGKLAVVTGGSGTIGQAIAKGLISRGSSVVLVGRRIEKLEESRAKLLEEHPSSTISIITSDVANEASVVSLFKKIDEEIGRVDLLINNAGTMAPGATTELSASDFSRVLSVNVLGPFLCAREALKRMKDGGRIINVGSISAYSPRPNGAAYTTTKFALQGLSRSLALDARQQSVAVGIIHPGNVRSELLSPEQIADREESEGFIGASSVAESVVTMASMPYSVNVLEMTVIPTRQPYVGRG